MNWFIRSFFICVGWSLLGLLAALLLDSQPLLAQLSSPSSYSPTTTGRLGSQHDKNAEDLNLSIDTRWCSATYGGYFPVRIQLENRGPDATVRFSVEPDTVGNNDGCDAVKSVLAKQNVATEVLLLVPATSTNSYFRLTVYKDDQLIEALNTNFGNTNNAYLGIGNDLVALLELTDNLAQTHPFENPHLAVPVAYFSVDLQNLPGNWLAYSAADIIQITADDFASLDEEVREAILDWVRVGGSLLINRCEKFENANESTVDSLLEMESTAATSQHWHSADPQTFIRKELSLRPNQIVARYRPEQNTTKRKASRLRERERLNARDRLLESAGETLESIDLAELDPEFMALRGYGFGEVIRVKGDLRKLEAKELFWLSQEVDLNGKQWVNRHGFNPRIGGYDFLDFVMRGIRILPTFAYVTLITLFCLIIGPLNYFYFYFKKRLTSILWSIPLISILASILLVAYSTVANGFETKTKLRSVTLLDQQNQTAVSMTRVAMFSGNSPRDGLKFSTDTAVYPVWPTDEMARAGTVDWTEAQNYDRSWIPSRTRQQFSLQTVRNERGRLSITREDDTTRIGNGLQWHIDKIIVCDSEGNRGFAENIAPGEQLTAQKLTGGNLEAFQEIIEDQKLESPVNSTRLSSSGRYSGGYFGGPDGITRGSYSTNLGELQLSWIKANDFQEIEMMPGSYIAILGESPSLEIGLEKHKVTEELHVVFGFN